MSKKLMGLVFLLLVSFLIENPLQAGFADSIGKSADRAGKSVERKTGQRSDNKNYKNYRLPESKIRVQLPIHFQMTKREKTGFKAVSKKEGIDLAVDMKSYKKQDAGGPSHGELIAAAKAAKNKGEIYLYTEKKVGSVRGVETVALADKGNRDSARTYKWEGFDAEKSKHNTIVAHFPPKKYDANKYDFEGIVNSVRWNYEETQNK